MALNSYQDIQGGVLDWVSDQSIAGRVKDFIFMAELRINRKLKTVDMEATSSAPFIPGQQVYPVPEGYLGMRNIFINSKPIVKLDYLTPEQLIINFPYTEAKIPTAYTMVNAQIKMNTIPQSTGPDMIISYFKAFPHLTDDVPKNWVTNNAGDLLLYAALVEAELFAVNDERVALWESKFITALDEINLQAEEKRFSGDTLSVRQEAPASFRRAVRR